MRILAIILFLGIHFNSLSQVDSFETKEMLGSISDLSIQYKVDTLTGDGVYVRNLDSLNLKLTPHYYFKMENPRSVTFHEFLSELDSIQLATGIIKSFNSDIREKSNLFYLANNSSTPISFYTKDSSSEFITEALDENGEWKPIEFEIGWSECGWGDGYIELRPAELVFFNSRKYTGEFKTTLRLKFLTEKGIIYSNEFDGAINRKQFKMSRKFRKILKKRFYEEDPFMEKYSLFEKGENNG